MKTRRRGEWRWCTIPEQTSESRLGTDLEDEIEHDGDDAVRWGEGEKAGDGSGGPWHSFECLGLGRRQQQREQDQEETDELNAGTYGALQRWPSA